MAAETGVFPWLYRDDNFPQLLQIEVRHQESSSPGANFWTSVNKLYALLPRVNFQVEFSILQSHLIFFPKFQFQRPLG